MNTGDIRLSVLVNTGPGRGIASVRAEDMVCRSDDNDEIMIIIMMIRCDPASCQCFHAQYEDTGTELEEASSSDQSDNVSWGWGILGMALSLR